MFIRATRVQTPPASIQTAIDNFERETLPRMRSAPGCLGGVLLVDRQTGAGVGITYWESAKAMAAGEQAGIQARTQVVQSTPGSQIVNVERFELMIMDRAAPPTAGGFVRLNTISGDPDKLDALTVYLRNSVLPVLRAQKGYRAMISSNDRQTGRSTVSTVWNSLDELRASESAVAGLRAEAAKIAGAGADGVMVEIFEGAVVELSAAVAATQPTA